MQGRTKKPSVRLQIVEALGGRCQWHGGCDVTDPDMIHVEHKNGDGALERKKYGERRTVDFTGRQNGSRSYSDVQYYRHILANVHSGRYQLLCANHNSKKHAIERRCKKWEGSLPCPFWEVTSA